MSFSCRLQSSGIQDGLLSSAVEWWSFTCMEYFLLQSRGWPWSSVSQLTCQAPFHWQAHSTPFWPLSPPRTAGGKLRIGVSYPQILIPSLKWLPTRSIPSVQFSHSVVSDSLRPHESQHARPPCPSPTPRVHSDSRPSSQWCHPAISSSVVLPFSSCPHSLPESESFPMTQLFAWGGQSIGVSALASFLPKKSQGWSPSEWTGCISLQFKGLSRVFSITTVQKHQFFDTQLSSQSNSHIHTWLLEKPQLWSDRPLLVTSLLFNMLSRLVIPFLPRNKRLLISWLQSPSAVILEPQKINSVTVSIVSPSICYEVMGLDDMILVF